MFVQSVKHGFGTEYFGGPFAAKQNGTFVKYGQAADGDRTAGADERIAGNSIEIAHVYGVKTPVETDGLHVNIGGQKLGLAGLDADGAVDGGLGTLGRIETQILDAVFI